MVNWEGARRQDGSLDLKTAYMLRYNVSSLPKVVDGYLDEIESMRPIGSRQVAAHILVNAHALHP